MVIKNASSQEAGNLPAHPETVVPSSTVDRMVHLPENKRLEPLLEAIDRLDYKKVRRCCGPFRRLHLKGIDGNEALLRLGIVRLEKITSHANTMRTGDSVARPWLVQPPSDLLKLQQIAYYLRRKGAGLTGSEAPQPWVVKRDPHSVKQASDILQRFEGSVENRRFPENDVWELLFNKDFTTLQALFSLGFNPNYKFSPFYDGFDEGVSLLEVALLKGYPDTVDLLLFNNALLDDVSAKHLFQFPRVDNLREINSSPTGIYDCFSLLERYGALPTTYTLTPKITKWFVVSITRDCHSAAEALSEVDRFSSRFFGKMFPDVITSTDHHWIEAIIVYTVKTIANKSYPNVSPSHSNVEHLDCLLGYLNSITDSGNKLCIPQQAIAQGRNLLDLILYVVDTGIRRVGHEFLDRVEEHFPGRPSLAVLRPLLEQEPENKRFALQLFNLVSNASTLSYEFSVPNRQLQLLQEHFSDVLHPQQYLNSCFPGLSPCFECIGSRLNGIVSLGSKLTFLMKDIINDPLFVEHFNHSQQMQQLFVEESADALSLYCQLFSIGIAKDAQLHAFFSRLPDPAQFINNKEKIDFLLSEDTAKLSHYLNQSVKASQLFLDGDIRQLANQAKRETLSATFAEIDPKLEERLNNHIQRYCKGDKACFPTLKQDLLLVFASPALSVLTANLYMGPDDKYAYMIGGRSSNATMYDFSPPYQTTAHPMVLYRGMLLESSDAHHWCREGSLHALSGAFTTVDERKARSYADPKNVNKSDLEKFSKPESVLLQCYHPANKIILPNEANDYVLEGVNGLVVVGSEKRDDITLVSGFLI